MIIQNYANIQNGFSRQFFKLNTKFGKRLYHNTAFVPSKYRKYLYYKLESSSSTNGELVIVEHRNCLVHLYLLNTLYDYAAIKFDYKTTLKKIDSLTFDKLVSNKNIKEELVHYFSLFIRSRDRGLLELLERKCNLDSKYLKYLDSLLYCRTENEKAIVEQSDFWILLICSKLGIIYDLILNLFLIESKPSISRKELKLLFNRFLNTKYQVIKKGSNKNLTKLSELIETLFPTFFKYLIKDKKNNYKNIAYKGFSAESKLMIDNIAKELLAKKKKFVPIHDGILCYRKDADSIKKMIELKSMNLFGLTSPIEIEPVM